MECSIEEVGMSQCMCEECQYNWQAFLATPVAVPVTSPSTAPRRCMLDPECECDLCVAGREHTEGKTIFEVLGDEHGQLNLISRSASYSGRVVGFELVNGSIWVWDYPRGDWDETPSFTVSADPTGLQKIIEHFDYCL